MKKSRLAIFLTAFSVLVLVAIPVSAQTGHHGMMYGQNTYEHMTENPWIGQCLMGHGIMVPGMMMGPGMMYYGYGGGPGMMHGGPWGQQGMPGYDEEALERMRKFQRNLPGFNDESLAKMRDLQRSQYQLMLALTEDEVDVNKARELYEKNLKTWNELALMRFDQAIKYLQENQ
ncbi:MAG: hypothetical protein JW971_06530 [Synergistales bacterium]|nr:hypothetical protein [Synergistales bacterium]